MPKNKPTKTFACDICDFKVSNRYIFKRHLHRCLSIHGIASKSSTSRNPMRLKGTEGLLTKDASGQNDSLKEDGEGEKLEDEDVASVSRLDRNGKEEEKTEGLEGSIDEVSLISETEKYGNTVSDTSHTEVNDSEVKTEVQSDSHPYDLKEKTNCPEQNNEEISITRTEGTSVPMETSRVLTSSTPVAPYSRKYKCDECPFECRSSREYLYHLRDVHGNRRPIYECGRCDYASRFNNKVERHMSVHKKKLMGLPQMEWKTKRSERLQNQLQTGTNLEGDEVGEGEESNLRVKPLKLLRLNKKTPSLFQVSDKSEGQTARKSKEVFKLILSENGSQFYQCRDCLYFSPHSHNVKKHHAVCHNKMLTCPHCSLFATTGQAAYYEHLLTHQNRGYTKCPDCSYVTNAKSNYEKHRSFHEREFPFKCTECSFGSDSESKIKRHMATQHRNPSAVNDCISVARKDLTEDLETAEEGVDISWEDMDLADEDMSGSLPETDVDSLMQQNEEQLGAKSDKHKHFEVEYRCPRCPMVCYRRANFTRHLTAKHKFNHLNAAALSKSLERPTSRGVKRKLPTYPSTHMKQRRLLLQSIGGESLKCSHCSYSAKWPSDLRRHMQVHTIVKRFKCSLCPNKYKYYGDLNVHMRRDHNAEPPANVSREVTRNEDVVKKASPAAFRCPICSFCTQSKAELEQHSRTHGDMEKTYQCRLCNYQTYWRGDVGRHLYRHHSVVLSKEASEMTEYFIYRPHIRPITKQPHLAGSTASLEQEGAIEGIGTSSSGVVPLVVGEEDSSASISQRPATSVVCLKEGSFVCEYPSCDFKTSTSDRMEAHLAVHLNLKQFMCPVCGKRTNWKWDVVKHLSKVHSKAYASVDEVITLPIEEAKATIDEYLNTMERKQKEMSVNLCSLCDFRSHERNRVVRHLGTDHKKESGKVITHIISSPEEYEASVNAERERNLSREKKVPNEKMLGENLKYVKVEEVQKVTKFEEPPLEELARYDHPYACAICKKPGLNKGDVKKHYNYAHPYKEVRVLYIPTGTEFNYDTGEVYQKSSKRDLGDSMLDLDLQGSPSKMIRPDSKFSNPKMHGYVKPFKCSICGLRSNWKWDLKKHLRSKHPNKGGFVIMLSIEEAQETYGTECTLSHPKQEDFLSATRASSGQTSPVSSLSSHSEMLKPVFDSGMVTGQEDYLSNALRGRDKVTNVDPNRRQWKCSGCDYISNWRRNMARHIHRKHLEQKDSIRVIPLHPPSRQSREAQGGQNLMDKFLQQGLPTMVKMETHPMDINLLKERKSSLAQPDNRIWRCPECPFVSQLRTHIIVHMQKHEMKPFKCGVCHLPFMNRGPLHRHIQKLHRRSDYVKLSKLNIKYDDNAEIKVTEKGALVSSFLCRLCNHESCDRSNIANHLLEVHSSQDPENILKVEKNLYTPMKPNLEFKSLPRPDPQKAGNRKFHFCPLCPYRSQKKSMLAFHMTYHRPSAVNRYKCKYCNYYVSTVRLLHQHQRKWHSDPAAATPEQEQHLPESPLRNWAVGTEGTPEKQTGSGSARRHCCEKCPYTTNSKNDFIYHKQFHRPKRTAEFKCEHCDYWVVHKRLLKQHMRLHTGATSPTAGALSPELSPAKSLYSDPGLVYDPVELSELAAVKQKMISDKITASLSEQPTISPMKLATRCSTDDKPGYVLKNGMYRKLHRCRFCPYTNVRARNMGLHEMMHGPRKSPHPLLKCPYCDYYVGSKGLLSHHMKVHQKSYGERPDGDGDMQDFPEANEDHDDLEQDIAPQQKVDTLLQISRFKKFGCEKCPYASGKRAHFERHLELHGSRQRYTCQFCDYSVPSNNLLLQHTKLHLMPNQNLLLSQSINNLQQLSDVPADVALASALPPADAHSPVTISVVHDHLGLYENGIMDAEPKKLYRCDRCPYANIRRDYLLSHLKFHMVSSSLVCPYCDYSAPKQALLTQHIRVHFCPLPELSDWLLETGLGETHAGAQSLDLLEALKVAHEYQNQSKKKDKSKNGSALAVDKSGNKEERTEGKENVQGSDTVPLMFICQYCEREFASSEKLVNHELQHLVGNHFEASLKAVTEQQLQQQQRKLQQQVVKGSSSEASAGQKKGQQAAGSSQSSGNSGRSSLKGSSKSGGNEEGVKDLAGAVLGASGGAGDSVSIAGQGKAFSHPDLGQEPKGLGKESILSGAAEKTALKTSDRTNGTGETDEGRHLSDSVVNLSELDKAISSSDMNHETERAAKEVSQDNSPSERGKELNAAVKELGSLKANGKDVGGRLEAEGIGIASETDKTVSVKEPVEEKEEQKRDDSTLISQQEKEETSGRPGLDQGGKQGTEETFLIAETEEKKD
ncbi:uncharacterized protein LOC101864368 [Aplysia californica]|uniref:Uncharacterized protein LOC101864368 n=1 Tax=Aplysia californica TaxID=6500 RepID=A0ABM1VP29_APLCA|nr:uncharacterized protein LOC101864368 [Aplysia californica]XP_005092654.1 uncharacterized protein LOC101864368 [Aplysia californica]XP_035824171.1 uncharacterized protein LOC101864368 [Aplysia californica]